MEVDADMVEEKLEEEEEAEEEEEESWPRRKRRRTTLIKSNNPHLAGGEKGKHQSDLNHQASGMIRICRFCSFLKNAATSKVHQMREKYREDQRMVRHSERSRKLAKPRMPLSCKNLSIEMGIESKH